MQLSNNSLKQVCKEKSSLEKGHAELMSAECLLWTDSYSTMIRAVEFRVSLCIPL